MISQFENLKNPTQADILKLAIEKQISAVSAAMLLGIPASTETLFQRGAVTQSEAGLSGSSASTFTSGN